MKLNHLIASLFLASMFTQANAQSISTTPIGYQIMKEPKIKIDQSSRLFSVSVNSPYNLTADNVIAQSKVDFEKTLKEYEIKLANSEKEYQLQLEEYQKEVLKAEERFKMENEEFKKLSLIERLALTDQRKNPKLVVPNKPSYIQPTKPVYRNPDLNNYIIVDNNVLASKINIDGFSKDGNYVNVSVDIKKITFQDNQGQTYANQPTSLIVKINGVEKVNTTFFKDFKFISSSPTNYINKTVEEKNHLNIVIATINSYLNDTFSFKIINRSVTLQSVKNKGDYDDLEKAEIYVSTNLKKLNPTNPEITNSALAGMQKGIDIWKETLAKVDYKDPKAVFNSKIAKTVYFNLINLHLALDKKNEAEKYLNEMQENLIYMKLNSTEQNELKNIENQIYKTT